MKTNYFRWFKATTLLLMVSFTISLIMVAYNFWQKSLVNEDSNGQVYEANAVLRELNEADSVEHIKNHVLRNNIKAAFDNFQQLDKNVNFVKAVKSPTKEDQVLKNTATELKEKIVKLTTYPSTTNLIQVLQEKSLKFTHFVNTNQWPTLSRISEKIQDNANKLSPIHFDSNSRLIRTIQADVQNIHEVSEKSTLTAEEKALISLKIKTVEGELKILNDFIDDQKAFLDAHEHFMTSFKQWGKTAKDLLQNKKASATNYTKEFLSQITWLVIASIAMVAIVFLSYGFFEKKQNKYNIESMKQMIESQLAAQNYKANKEQSPELDKLLKNYHQYFQKRMNMGTLLGETIPMPAILLDSNLKVIWANQMFLEEWDITTENIENDNFSWDFLKRFTDLEDADPVVEAFRIRVSGIYDVSIQKGPNEARRKFELFVSPIEQNSNVKVMVYFNCIEKYQELISKAAQELSAPVHQAIETMISSGFSESQLSSQSRHFEVISARTTFEKLKHLNQFMCNQRESLVYQIEHFEKLYQDQIQYSQNVEIKNRELLTGLRELGRKLNNLKQHLLAHTQEFETYSQSMHQIADAQEVLEKHMVVVHDLNVKLVSGVSDYATPITEMIKVRDEFKDLKQEILCSKARITTNFDQYRMFENTTSLLDQEKMAAITNKLKAEFLNLERSLYAFEKKFAQLDTQLTKAQILIPDASSEANKLMPQSEAILDSKIMKINEQITDADSIAERIYSLEEQMIQDFESLYSSLRNVLSQDSKAKNLGNKSSTDPELSTT